MRPLYLLAAMPFLGLAVLSVSRGKELTRLEQAIGSLIFRTDPNRSSILRRLSSTISTALRPVLFLLVGVALLAIGLGLVHPA